MRDVYISTEVMSMLIILILLYANIFESKQRNMKRFMFTHLLLLNAIVVLLDGITWLDLGWENKTIAFNVLISMTYIVPFLVQGVFSRYLYEHISEQSDPKWLPFKLVVYYSVVVGVVTLILCATGKIFVVEDGLFYPGEFEPIYYSLFSFSMLYFVGVILANSKRLGIHDTIAAMSFCIVPLAAMVIAMSPIGINLVVQSVAFESLIIYIMLQSNRESTLLFQSNNDELTGLLNRRAYEDDRMNYLDVPPEADFVFATIDINSLKEVNDNMGHIAGDELICATADCLKRTLGSHGRVYRTGGDEFVSIFFADEKHLKPLLDDLHALVDGWRGIYSDSLAISIGCASKAEFPELTIEEMGRVADLRMYEDKELYYAGKSVDRRRESEAHKVMCALYVKILKINITNDTFSIINMDRDEQRLEMGFSKHISQWLEDFARKGYVHPDDLEEFLAVTDMDYMREYFKQNKTSLSISYRRKYDDEFKQVMVEIVPANDYSDDDQSLFLYVKKIDI